MRAKLREYESQTKRLSELDARRQAEAGEYVTSYEKATARLAELAPIVDEHKELREYISSQLDEQLKELPEEYRDLIPQGLPLKERLAQVNRLRKLAGKQVPTQPKVPPASAPPSSLGSVVDIRDPALLRKALLEMPRDERDKLLAEQAKSRRWGGK